MNIYDKSGNVVATSEPPDTRIFDNMVIHNAYLAGLELEGISFDGSDLQCSDFTGADLYGSTLSDANFESCSFKKSDLRFSIIHNVSFRNADMRGARMSLDELGGGLCLYEADFTNANLDGVDFTGAAYDSKTIFPDGFDPSKRGLVRLGEASEDHITIMDEQLKSQGGRA